jgi:hypothetical protein
VIDNTPLTGPTAVGVKTTEIWQVPFAGTETQVWLMANGPVTVGAIGAAVAPVFVIVMT